jgi:sarcosine/dimethylglycine N-methyltransferase
MSHVFTEGEVEDFFDQTLPNYLGFWDSEGVLHTGVFAGQGDGDYRAAAQRTSALLAAGAEIGPASYVLDVGCGCGNFLTYLAERYGCRGEGLDISGERIKFARQRLASGDAGYRDRIGFRQGSATRLPYQPATFSHVVSQDALFLIPDKARSHEEVLRVLRPGGIFAFSDFLQPVRDIGESARKHVYDRVRWSGGYSLAGYRAALETAGFEVIETRDLRPQIRQTYQVLGGVAAERAAVTTQAPARDWMLAFAESCGHIQAAIDRDEFGWGMIFARKPAGS